MCMLYMCYTAKPPADALRWAAKANDDGAGIAYLQRGRVRVVRSLDSEYIIRMFLSPRVPLPAMVHFRLASAGGVDLQLCHPFPVTPSGLAGSDFLCDAALAQNGHWSDWYQVVASILAAAPTTARARAKLCGPWSDTRALAVAAARIGFKSPLFAELCSHAGRVGILAPGPGLVRLGHWPAADEQESRYGYVASVYAARTVCVRGMRALTNIWEE
jgi:hypothetical protein